jgi:hypothetical protein
MTRGQWQGSRSMRREHTRMQSCDAVMERVWRKRVRTDRGAGGVVQPCCIVVFLAQASDQSGAHRQHVGANGVKLISFAGGNR